MAEASGGSSGATNTASGGGGKVLDSGAGALNASAVDAGGLAPKSGGDLPIVGNIPIVGKLVSTVLKVPVDACLTMASKAANLTPTPSNENAPGAMQAPKPGGGATEEDDEKGFSFGR